MSKFKETFKNKNCIPVHRYNESTKEEFEWNFQEKKKR